MAVIITCDSCSKRISDMDAYVQLETIGSFDVGPADGDYCSRRCTLCALARVTPPRDRIGVVGHNEVKLQAIEGE